MLTLRYWRADVQAGIGTAIVMLPQAMAYALLAGLSPVHGLYAATLPVMFYGIFGTSPHVSVAPVALLAIMHGSLLSHVPQEEYVAQSILLTGLVGVLLCLFWVLRLGSIAQKLSHSVIEGFIQAAAILTALSQIKYLIGVSIPKGVTLVDVLLPIAKVIPQAQLHSIIISVVCMGVLLLRYVKTGPPYPLIAVAVGSVMVFGGMPAEAIGALDRVLPELAVPHIDMEHVSSVFSASLLIALVSYVESFALAQHFAAKHRYRIKASRELIALGGANLVSSFVGGLAVGAGFSRSAIHEGGGAKTKFAGIFSAIVVLGILFFLSSLLAYVPYAALAAIVFLASLRLVQPKRVFVLYRYFKKDFWLFAITCIAVLFLGISIGLALALCAQFVLYPWKAQPLGIQKESSTWKISGRLDYIRAATLCAALSDSEGKIQVDCSRITYIDAGAIIELQKIDIERVDMQSWRVDIQERIAKC